MFFFLSDAVRVAAPTFSTNITCGFAFFTTRYVVMALWSHEDAIKLECHHIIPSWLNWQPLSSLGQSEEAMGSETKKRVYQSETSDVEPDGVRHRESERGARAFPLWPARAHRDGFACGVRGKRRQEKKAQEGAR